MKRNLIFVTSLTFLAATLFTIVSGVAVACIVGNLTDSGFAGICGAYGPDAGVVAGLFFGSFPAGLIAGISSAWLFYRQFSRRP